GIDTQTYRALSQSPVRPLFNRAFQGQYPPGSTLKPFIGLAGLELGTVGAAESLTCHGWYTLKNDERRYRDWKKEGHGLTDLDRAIVESCDVYFYDLSLALGIDKLHDYLSGFGVGIKTGIDLPGELAGLMPSREWKRRTRNLPWFPGETLITGIGQGFMLSTPLQLAAVTATLAMRGERFEPQLVYGVKDPNTRQVSASEPQALTRVNLNEPRHWDTVINSMERVVHSLRGTARSISQNLNYRIAGKTGTAQVFGIKQDEEYIKEDIAKKLRDHALFIAFAPVDTPRIAVAVIVENGGSGGAVAAPIARKVMDAWLLGKAHGAG
ncbi:MAG: penicillin-binding protein 2, partial [Pseudomonadota bacterium]